MTLSLSAVFIPVLFMGGVLGRLLHEFAVTIMTAILVSGFVSLTLTPMLCSRFLKPHRRSGTAGSTIFSSPCRWGLSGFTIAVFRFSLRHKFATMMFSVALAVGTYYLAVIIPKGFLPSEDIDQINGTTEAIEGISFDAMVEHQNQIAEIVAKDPAVDYVLSSIGSGGRTLNQGGLNIRLKPRAQRQQVDQVINELRPKLATVPGMVTYLRNDPTDPHRWSAKQGTLPVHNTEPAHGGALQFGSGFHGQDEQALRASRMSAAISRSEIPRSTSKSTATPRLRTGLR